MIALLCAAAIHLAAAYLPISGSSLGAPVPSFFSGSQVDDSFLPDPNGLPMPEIGPSPNPNLPPTLLPDESQNLWTSGEASRSSSPPASASVAMPGPKGRTIVIWADRIEALTDGRILRASGHVRVRYEAYTLTAGQLYFDGRDQRGRADRDVDLEVRGYSLKTDHFSFDLIHEKAQAVDWSGSVPRRGRANGKFLYLSPSYALARDVTFSPCMADDPGYYLSSSTLRWYPFRGRQEFEGRDVSLHVSGATLGTLPEIDSSFKPRKDKKLQNRPLGLQAGYDAYQGAFAAGAGAFALGNFLEGSLPFRITQGRGLLFGTQDTTHLGSLSMSGDASYQTPFAGGTYGPRANVDAEYPLFNGGSLSLGGGYRSDINGQAVDRLGDLNVSLGNLSLGPFTLAPTARLGDFWELSPTSTLQWWPLGEQPHARALVASAHAALIAPAWKPNAFWETDTYAWGTATRYVERDAVTSWIASSSDLVSAVVGLNNIQRWSPRLSTAVGAETDQLIGRSPFYFDQAPSGDRVFGSTSYAWTKHWYTDLGVNFYHPPQAATLDFNDATLRLTYRAACLTWSITTTMTLAPFNLSVNFGYSVGVD